MGVNLQLMGGEVLLEKYNADGVTLGAIYKPGTTDTFSFNTSVETTDHYNTETEEVPQDGLDYGKRTVAINFETRDINSEFDKIAFKSTVASSTQAAQSAVAVVIASTVIGKIEEIGYLDITSLIVKDVTDAVTYTSGIDYEYDRKWGTITIPIGSNIVAGVEIHLTIDANEVISDNHTSFTSDKVEFRLTYKGRSSKGRNEKHVWEKVSLSLDGDRVLKSGGNEYTAYSFVGASLEHNGKTHSMQTY